MGTISPPGSQPRRRQIRRHPVRHLERLANQLLLGCQVHRALQFTKEHRVQLRRENLAEVSRLSGPAAKSPVDNLPAPTPLHIGVLVAILGQPLHRLLLGLEQLVDHVRMRNRQRRRSPPARSGYSRHRPDPWCSPATQPAPWPATPSGSSCPRRRRSAWPPTPRPPR